MNFAVIDMIRGMSVLRTYPINEDNPVKNMIQEKAHKKEMGGHI